MAERKITRGVALPHLRDWRRYKGMPQDELAGKAGIAASTVYRAERGGAIDMVKARALAGALGITYEQLVNTGPDTDTKAEPAA